jgi:hypothetical protein
MGARVRCFGTIVHGLDLGPNASRTAWRRLMAAPSWGESDFEITMGLDFFA